MRLSNIFHRGVFFCLCFIVAFIKPASAQPPHIQWQSTYGGSFQDFGSFIQQTTDSGYIAIGTSYSYNDEITDFLGLGDVWVLKIDKTGTLLWEKSFGGSNYDFGTCIQQTNDGGYILVGTTSSTNDNITTWFGGNDVWVAKLDNIGNLLWQKSYGGSGDDVGIFIQQIANGGYIVTTHTTSGDGEVTGFHGGSGYDIWLVRIDDTGAILWQKTYGGTGDDKAFSMQQTSDSGFIVAGITASTDGDISHYFGGAYDYWVIKVNDTGHIQWQNTYGGSGDDEGASIAKVSNGGYVLTGYSTSTDSEVVGNHGGYDIWTLKLNDTGRIIWSNCHGGSSNDYSSSVIQSNDKGFVICGTTLSNDGDVTGYFNHGDAWIVKLDSAGNMQWQKNFGGDSLDAGISIIQSFDSEFVFIGQTKSTDHDVTHNFGFNDYWIVKLQDSSTTGISSNTSEERSIKVYPVPTTGILNIVFQNISNEQVKLELFDMSGNSVYSKNSRANNETIILNGLSKGIYLLRITDRKNVATYRVVYY